jgi:hypothetical protein
MPENIREQGPDHGKRAGGYGQQSGAWCDRVHAVPPCAEPGAEWKGGDIRLLCEHARDHATERNHTGRRVLDPERTDAGRD